MARKVYTVEFDEKNIESTVGSKSSKVVADASQNEIESLGVVEINNNSAKKKIKNSIILGFEKNITGAEKKSVKTELSKVDDYFDFSFRKSEPMTEEKPKKERKTCAKKVKVIEEIKDDLVCEVSSIDVVEEINDVISCDTFFVSEEAQKVISVARAGALFG